MFRLIVEKELREIVGSAKFAVTFGISSLRITSYNVCYTKSLRVEFFQVFTREFA